MAINSDPSRKLPPDDDSDWPWHLVTLAAIALLTAAIALMYRYDLPMAGFTSAAAESGPPVTVVVQPQPQPKAPARQNDVENNNVTEWLEPQPPTF